MERNEYNKDIFEGDMHGGCKHFYFNDPDGNNVEIIFPYVQKDWSVNEIGMPSNHVSAFAAFLEEGLADTFQHKGELFRFYGDEKGVFVLVHDERPWFPTKHIAQSYPIHIVVSGKKDTTLQHPTLPYPILTTVDT
ncbi:VOC family protein [Longirhabdus pacifica]|uniref:VOC family protein n=1 Tax=Longirhabdus pacifica TaxID=2305227 RepID=UPI001008FAD6|nr:hypothetical protein [Longirhabdus pacifica]